MGKLLFTASTYSHLLHFHLPYLKAFTEQGWTLHAACGGEPALVPYITEMIHLPLEKSITAPQNLRAAAILRERVRGEGYDLIVTHTSLAAFFTRLALKGLRERPPLINMVHGYLFDDETPAFKRSLLAAAERLTVPQTDFILTMNQWDYAFASRHHLASRIEEIPGIGVDFSRFGRAPSRLEARAAFGIPEDAFVLVYAAEFSRRKSQAVLLRAMAQLPERVLLVLAGEGTERPACEELASMLDVSSRVWFAGYQPDMLPWYAAADVAVTASRSEGLPFNVMESMYMGLPVVASAVKGHMDLIEDGVTGLLYPYGDSEACAAQVCRLLDSPPLHALLAERAKANVLRYGLDEVFPQVMERYCSMLPDGIVFERQAFLEPDRV